MKAKWGMKMIQKLRWEKKMLLCKWDILRISTPPGWLFKLDKSYKDTFCTPCICVYVSILEFQDYLFRVSIPIMDVIDVAFSFHLKALSCL